MKRIIQAAGGHWLCDVCLRIIYMTADMDIIHAIDDSPVCDLPEDVARQAWRDSANRIADQETSGPTT